MSRAVASIQRLKWSGSVCWFERQAGRSTRARGIWAIGQIGRWGNLIVSMDGYARTHVIMDLRDLPFLPQKYTTTIACYIHQLYTTILFDIISSLQNQASIFLCLKKKSLLSLAVIMSAIILAFSNLKYRTIFLPYWLMWKMKVVLSYLHAGDWGHPILFHLDTWQSIVTPNGTGALEKKKQKGVD